MSTFPEIPSGAALFLDANTFVYHFTAQPLYGSACTALLERIERSDVIGLTSAHILAEVSHRLMTIEACIMFGWPARNIATRLAKHPEQIAKLTLFERALSAIDKLALRVIPVTEGHLARAAGLSRQYGLLTNDALLVGAMLESNVKSVATNDADFDRVPSITRFAPA